MIGLAIFGFFKDDHNRVIRVIVFLDKHTMCVHVLYKLPDGKKAWVPFNQFNLEDAKKSMLTKDLERIDLLVELTEAARQCPLFNKEGN